MLSDEHFMHRALTLAKLGSSHTAPNPLVGAVIVHNDRIIGEGYHRKSGEPHAEVNAVNSVTETALLPEATIYVTLEPCAHYGKTPPCANLLVDKRFKRVVIGVIDPFARVAGQGIAILQQAGIDCSVGVLEEECRQLNKRFFTFHEQHRPYVLLKWAQTVDGFIDAPRENDEVAVIRRISSPETLPLVHHWRSEEQAILVGWRTILNDNPSLTVRAVSGKNPLRIVIDPHLKAPKDALVFTDGLPTIVLNGIHTGENGAVRFVRTDDFSPAAQLRVLAGLNIISVMVEGGQHTLQAYINSGLWDEARVILSEASFGGGVPAPVLGQVPDNSVRAGSDFIHHFVRHA